MSIILNKISKLHFKLCLMVLIVSYLTIAFLFSYEDIVSYTTWSVNFWDLLFQGKLGEFYVYAQENLRQAPFEGFCGSYLTIFPWILWNFPLYLTHPFPEKITVDSMPCILWSKLLLVVCIVGIGVFAYKIVKDIFNLAEEQAWIAVLLSVGGYEIIDSTVYAGQDEVIYIFLFLASLYLLLRGSTKGFLIGTCLSVTVCPIMLIPFLTVFLICEKNIFKLLLGTIFTLTPSLLFEIAYSNDEIYQRTKEINTSGVFECMMNGDLVGTALGNISLVGVALVILFFICYVTEKKEKEEENIFLIYAISISFFIICFMAPFNVFYRFGIYAPFWAVLVVLKKNRLNMNVFLMMIISYGRAFCSFGYSPNPELILTQNWNSKFFMPEILSRLDGKIKLRATSEMISSTLGDKYFMALFMARTVIFAGALILLVINRSKEESEFHISVPYRLSMFAYMCSSIIVLLAFGVGIWIG